jgi:hypothetical protein
MSEVLKRESCRTKGIPNTSRGVNAWKIWELEGKGRILGRFLPIVPIILVNP